ncbi:hypothetical protein D3C81_1243520 [compost metagenome]
MDMVTTEVLMNENTRILDDLAAKTKEMLQQHSAVFDKSLDLLFKEERLSGEQFRCQFRDSVDLPA